MAPAGERDPGSVALPGAADHLVALKVVTGTDAAVAENAGLVVDRDDRRAGVGTACVIGSRQGASVSTVVFGQGPQRIVTQGFARIVLGVGLIRHQ